MRPSHLAFVLASLAISTASHALNMDVNGITVGSKFNEEVKTALQKINPAYEITNIVDEGKQIGYIAAAGNSYSPYDAFVVMGDKSGNIWFAARKQRLGEGKRIHPDVLLSSLKEKYGELSASDTSRFTAIWRYSKDTNQIPLPSVSDDPCLEQYSPSFKGIAYPAEFKPACQIAITAKASLDKDQLVDEYTVTVYDARPIHDEILHKEERERAAREQAEAERRQKAASEGQANKPNL